MIKDIILNWGAYRVTYDSELKKFLFQDQDGNRLMLLADDEADRLREFLDHVKNTDWDQEMKGRDMIWQHAMKNKKEKP